MFDFWSSRLDCTVFSIKWEGFNQLWRCCFNSFKQHQTTKFFSSFCHRLKATVAIFLPISIPLSFILVDLAAIKRDVSSSNFFLFACSLTHLMLPNRWFFLRISSSLFQCRSPICKNEPFFFVMLCNIK